MKVQGLIERYEKFKASKKKLTSVDLVLKDLRSLDEPEPLPFKLKDVVRRIRGFDPTTQTRWLNDILKELGDDYGSMKYRSGYQQGKLEGAWVGNQLKDADKIRQELNRPVVPQFVADWYEEHKYALEFNIFDYIYRFDQNPEVDFKDWLDDLETNSIQTLVNMHQFGYDVEEEKRYTVVMKETKQPLYYNAGDKKVFFSLGGLATNFTRKELEEAGFGEVFTSKLFEVKEVD